ncbi:hypothetical protein D0T12_23200 [Actinomadura spongiicola]|uniref:Uncharacterized protein n=1 Tax=Actinomadura spongiicola TaxID=2303421 RepID=A0A372GD33_9ACTN|nr:hypothetical protein [Actinomadura spongiicola]RFS83092.1 hypothetical protein D0T12_23200 [Actinomadura spongiicola]
MIIVILIVVMAITIPAVAGADPYRTAGVAAYAATVMAELAALFGCARVQRRPVPAPAVP